jgi:putative transposase
MVRFSFRKGLRFLQETKIWTLLKRTATSKLQFECEDSGEIEVLTEQEVYRRWSSANWQVDETSLGPTKELIYLATPKDLRSLKADEQKEVKRRLEYLNLAQDLMIAEPRGFVCDPERLTRSIRAIATERGDKTPPSWSTFWRWWTAYRATRCFSKLVDGRCSNHFKTDPVQFSVFEEVVNEVFLNKQRMPGKAVADGVADRFVRMNRSLLPDQQQKPPARSTIYRWLDKLYRAVVDESREGKAYTERELRIVTGALKVKDILERWEIDHTPLDVLVVCRITRMVLGRPWLTLVIDRRSRMVMGFYISFHAPSAYSVLYALRMAIRPKDDLVGAMSGIKNPWPARGLPTKVVVDNGMELHSDAIDLFALEAGIEIQYCPAAHPELKGAVERIFRTLSQSLFHQMPGTVFNCVDARRDYPSEQAAALDIDTVTTILVKWIVDVYHCSPHEGLQGQTPLAVWQALEGKRAFELPAYPRQLDLMVGQIATRTLFHYGVEYDHVRYNSVILGSLLERSRKKLLVQIRVYEHDISYVDVLMPDTDEYVRVPANDQDYCEGLNRHSHLLVRRQVVKRFGDEWTQQQLREAKAEIQQMIAEALRGHKAAKRKKAAAHSMQDSDAASSGRASQAMDQSLQPLVLDKAPPLPVLAQSALLPKFNISTQDLEMA